jgi:alkaline phosphatase D
MKRQIISLLLAASALPLAATAFAAKPAAVTTTAGPATAPPLEKLDGFTHGPMLGNVGSTSIRVWARTRQPGSFRILYSEKADLSGGTLSAPVATDWSHDATGWVELTGLKPDTRYHYALVLDGKVADTRVDGAINSFRTLASAAEVADPALNPKGIYNFAFEVGTGNAQHGRPNIPPTYATMRRNLKDKLAFQIQNGDWVYEEGREVATPQWAAANKVAKTPRSVTIANGITGVWQNYKAYLDGSEALRDFYRDVPLLITLDDHEILNDVIGSGEIGFRTDARGKGFQTDIRSRTDRDSDVERAVFRDPASAAWYDYVGWANPDPDKRPPIRFGEATTVAGSDILTDNSTDFSKLDLTRASNLHVLWGFGNTGVYKIEKVLGPHKLKVSPAFTVGEKANYSIGTNGYSKFRVSNTDIFLLDTRSNRTLHERSGEGTLPKTMLGAEQKAWLEAELRKSDADFIFIVSSVNLAIPHDNGVWYGQGLASATKDDGWTAQLKERAEVLAIAQSLGKPVFFLTGDLHKSFVARIAPGVYDVGTGPHTSAPHRLGDAGGSPPSGWYDSGDRLVNLLWSSNQYRNDSEKKRVPGQDWPVYTVVKVNNAYNIPDKAGKDRWIAYPEPQVIFEFHDGYSGELLFAHSVSTSEAKAKPEPVSLDRVKQLGGIDAK